MSAPVWGSSLVLSEVFTWVHTDDATAAEMDLTRTLTPGQMIVNAQLSITTASMDLGWFYTAMLPAVQYNSAWDKNGFQSLRISDGSTYTLTDYSGGTTDITLNDINGAAYFGDFDDFFASGVWQDAARDLLIRTNIDGVTDGDGSTWPTKTYLRRASDVSPETVEEGQLLTWSATHFDTVALL